MLFRVSHGFHIALTGISAAGGILSAEAYKGFFVQKGGSYGRKGMGMDPMGRDGRGGPYDCCMKNMVHAVVG